MIFRSAGELWPIASLVNLESGAHAGRKAYRLGASMCTEVMIQVLGQRTCLITMTVSGWMSSVYSFLVWVSHQQTHDPAVSKSIADGTRVFNTPCLFASRLLHVCYARLVLLIVLNLVSVCMSACLHACP